MTIAIGLIVWPEDSSSAIRLYLGYLVKVLDALGVEFSGEVNDPLRLAKEYLEGRVSEEERGAAASVFLNCVSERGGARNFHDKDVVMARLALCLLAVKERDVPELGEHLSWFLELLGFLGVSLDKPIEIMDAYFQFSR